ncbi:MAG: glutamate 5-kinase [Chloroflexota bacterium]|nr:glutamate 5-kinase [Dehalococcoidia bacterium]MDW8253494.1 glutamate 5-kinase [Chloroflexota bacterium]
MDGATAARARLSGTRRLVVKLGTNVLTGGKDRLDLARIASLVEQIARQWAAGREVIVVSSGAVAAGRSLLSRAHLAHHRSMPHRQILASVGQSRLMAVYDQLFGWHDIIVAQALLTRADLADRTRFLNARTTLISLVEHRVVPIVNENDVVAVDELHDLTFGDNDALSGQVANLVDADLLLILTDIDGLYTKDPRRDPTARRLAFVPVVDDTVEAMAGGVGSERGRGGMRTKVQAARLATAAGTAVVIASGSADDVIARVLAGEPLGTLFAPSQTRLEGRKRWLLSGMGSKGCILVDAGAAVAIRERGKSLLPAGVVAVEGRFERGDTVSILALDRTLLAYGTTSYSAADIDRIRGVKSRHIADVLGYDYGAEVVHRNNLVVIERGDARLDTVTEVLDQGARA